MSTDDVGIAGPVDYNQFLQALIAEDIGKPYTKQIELPAGATVTEAFDFPKSNASLMFIQMVAVGGTTDADLSIHEDDSYSKLDMIYSVSKVSIADQTPTGGYPNSAHGLPYNDANQNDKLYVSATENSGTNGALLLKVKYI